MLHQLIKKATHDMHAELEDLMYVQEVMAGTLTFQQYKQMIMTNYLVTSFFENHLIHQLQAEVALQLQIHKRLKLPALLKDVEEAGINAAGISTDLSPMTTLDHEEVLGCLYVLEGATLGGHVIFKRLINNELLKNRDLQFNFYRVYGDNLVSYWKQFCEVLNQQPAESYPKIIRGAKYIYSEFLALKLGK